MYKVFIILFFLHTSTIAQRSITASYNARGIIPSSGYSTITNEGIKKTSSKKDISRQKDSVSIITSTLKNSTVVLFTLVDSIVWYHNKVEIKPSICGGYGVTSWYYNNGKTNQLLFCIPSMRAYNNYNILIKKEKNNTKKQRLIQQLDNATTLYNLYIKLSQLFNAAV